MKVLIADSLASTLQQSLHSLGCTLQIDPSLKEDSLTEQIEAFQPNILVVRSTKVQKNQLLNANSLSLIIRAGAGTNTIDVDTASEKGIFVANCPGKNAIAVAELAMGHLINMDRRISDNVQDLREGSWNKKLYSKSKGLYGKELAIVGIGSCGTELIHRAKAFGMNIRAYSRSFTPEKAALLGVQYSSSPLEACQGADALSVHLAYTPETRGIIGELELNSLKSGGYVINTSRGGIIDEAALLEAIENKGLRAGFDVFENEPSAKACSFSSPLIESPSVYGTHHIGASTEQASEMICSAVVEIIETLVTSGTVINCVNVAKTSTADHTLSIRHADKVGVLASILDTLKKGGHNIQEMENIIFKGGKAACAQIQIIGKPNHQVLSQIRDAHDIFSISIKELSNK